MSKFIDYLSSVHWNGMNVALYKTGAVKAENVINGTSIGARTFPDPEAAREWFAGLGDDDLNRLWVALDELNPRNNDLRWGAVTTEERWSWIRGDVEED